MPSCKIEQEFRLQVAVALESMSPEEVRDAVEVEIEQHLNFLEEQQNG